MKMSMACCIGALCALALSGCSLVDQIGALRTADEDVTAPMPSDLEADVDWYGADDPESTAAQSARGRSTTGDGAVPRPKTKPEVVDPKTLVGLDKQSIELIFGAPHHITLAQPATVWAWELDGCRMRLFFYPDLTAQKFRALAYEISATQPEKNATLIETCASRIKWANAKTISK